MQLPYKLKEDNTLLCSEFINFVQNYIKNCLLFQKITTVRPLRGSDHPHRTPAFAAITFMVTPSI